MSAQIHHYQNIPLGKTIRPDKQKSLIKGSYQSQYSKVKDLLKGELCRTLFLIFYEDKWLSHASTENKLQMPLMRRLWLEGQGKGSG